MRPSITGRLLLAAIALPLLVLLLRDRTVGKQAPAFSLREAYGGRVDLESYRGRPVLLVFWATSCGYCRRELPILDNLAPEFQGRGLVMLAIHVGDVDGARQFMREKQLSRLTNLVDEDASVSQKYGVHGVPRLVLIGPDGKVQRAVSGMQSADTLRAWFERATRS